MLRVSGEVHTHKAGHTLLPCCGFVLLHQTGVGQGGIDVGCPLSELSNGSGLSGLGGGSPVCPIVSAAVVLCVSDQAQPTALTPRGGPGPADPGTGGVTPSRAP